MGARLLGLMVFEQNNLLSELSRLYFLRYENKLYSLAGTIQTLLTKGAAQKKVGSAFVIYPFRLMLHSRLYAAHDSGLLPSGRQTAGRPGPSN